MSDVETIATPILKPMLRGLSVTLDDESQTILRAWIVLRGMILERGGSAPSSRRFYTRQEQREFADVEYEGSLVPIDGTYIWSFQHQSPQWVARANVANLGLHATPDEPPSHLQVMTAFIGLFGFQILLGRWPDRRRLEWNSPHVQDWQAATTVLWPTSASPVEWPPAGGYLTDDTMDEFMDRFTQGFPLQRMHRTSRR